MLPRAVIRPFPTYHARCILAERRARAREGGAVKKLWSLVSTCFRSLTDARLEICGAFITGSRRCQLSQPSPGSQRPLVGLRHILRVYMCCGRDYVCCGQVTEEAGVSMPHIAGRGSTLGGCYCPDYLARALDPRVNFVPLVEHHLTPGNLALGCASLSVNVEVVGSSRCR